MEDHESEPQEFDEVSAFFILIYIMHAMGHRELIRPGLPKLNSNMEALDKSIRRLHPDLAKHIQYVYNFDDIEGGFEMVL